MEGKTRIEWVDYTKAFACFLVVLAHLLQSLWKSNIDYHMEITTFINWFIYLFHMPLFMCMSGFLYCKTKKEFSWKYYKKFEGKKIINLLVPYFTFYLLFVGINMLFANEVNNARGTEDILNIFNNPMPPYWFLYALLSIFIVTPLLEKICKNQKKIIFGMMVIAKILSIYMDIPIYIISSIFRWGIYFYIGTFIGESQKLEKCQLPIIYCFGYIIGALLIYNTELKDNSYVDIVFAILGILISVDLFKRFEKHRILDTFKKYTFQIYLIHTICAAGIRIVLLKLGIKNYWIHLSMGLIFSIYVPVGISIISNKIQYTNFFFYPIKTIKELKERKIKSNG